MEIRDIVDGEVWEVRSDPDKPIYTVRLIQMVAGDNDVLVCECKGYEFTGHCKHVTALQVSTLKEQNNDKEKTHDDVGISGARRRRQRRDPTL